jgi:hypothetical protein
MDFSSSFYDDPFPSSFNLEELLGGDAAFGQESADEFFAACMPWWVFSSCWRFYVLVVRVLGQV